MAVEICKLNVFDYLEKKFIPPGALLFAARCCYEMEDLCMALCYLISNYFLSYRHFYGANFSLIQIFTEPSKIFTSKMN